MLNFDVKILPRDVSTRWNSTFDMLEAALSYRRVINTITSDIDNNLRDFELRKEEWTILEQLRDVLIVSVTCVTTFVNLARTLDSQTGHTVLLTTWCSAESCHGYSRNGQNR